MPIGDLYDEFTFGEHDPSAIKQFLQTANRNWKKAPTYLLLNGRASLDPRNYLGFGNLDLVPTRIVPTATLMTASDDWFSDFSNTGMPTIATGRLPVSTADEAATVVGKIVAYEGQSTNGPWTSNALMVADKDDTESFTGDSQMVQASLPASMQISSVFVDTVGTTAARGDIVNGINSGQVLVNYLGHGSEEQWSGSDILDTRYRQRSDEQFATPGVLHHGLPEWLLPGCLRAASRSDITARAPGRCGGGSYLERSEPGCATDKPRCVGCPERIQRNPCQIGRCNCECESRHHRLGRSEDLRPVRRPSHAGEASCSRQRKVEVETTKSEASFRS